MVRGRGLITAAAKMYDARWTVFLLVGIAAAVHGISLWSKPAAWLVLGLALSVAAVFGKRGAMEYGS